jgi:hypothetical protein
MSLMAFRLLIGCINSGNKSRSYTWSGIRHAEIVAAGEKYADQLIAFVDTIATRDNMIM